MEEVHRTGSIRVLTLVRTGETVGTATGTFLFNYGDSTTALLLTAKHIFFQPDTAHSLLLLRRTDDGAMNNITKEPIPLYDSDGDVQFLTYGTQDMALLPISLKSFTTTVRALNRSGVSFSRDVLNGDHVLLFGAGSSKFVRYDALKQFLVTSGTVALQTDSTYLIDQQAFPGMSGGIAWKEEIGIITETKQLVYTYTAIGVVVSDIREQRDYTNVIKIDYVDSILYSNTDAIWDRPIENHSE